MRFWLIFLLALVGSWVQIYFLASWRPLGVVPNLLSVILILLGLRLRVSDALWLAILAGLFADLSSGADFGLRMGFYSLLALLGAVLGRLGADFENIGLIILVLLIATSLFNLAVVSSLVFQGDAVSWPVVFWSTAKEFALNTTMLLVLRPIINRLGTSTGVPEMRLRRQGA